MLKKNAIKRIITSTLALGIFLIICLFPKDDALSVPEEVIYVNEFTEVIYAQDNNGYIARTTIYKTNDDIIKYIIDALTINSKSSAYLPSGFTSTIPENTKLIDYQIDKDLLKLNFSKEILNVSKENENKLIESLIYSLTEIDGIKSLMLFVEGDKLNYLPSGKSLPLTLDKNYGINTVYDINDIKGTSKTTIYYIGKYEENLYYIPITKITNDNKEKIEIIVNELKRTPVHETNLISYLTASYELKDYTILEDAINVSFNNEAILGLKENDAIESVKYMVALSLRDTYDIDNIIVNIN